MSRPRSSGLAWISSVISPRDSDDRDVDRLGVLGELAGEELGDGLRTRAGDPVALAAISSSNSSGSRPSSNSASSSSSTLTRTPRIARVRRVGSARSPRRRACRRPAPPRPAPRRRSPRRAAAAAAGASAFGSGAGFSAFTVFFAGPRPVTWPRRLSFVSGFGRSAVNVSHTPDDGQQLLRLLRGLCALAQPVERAVGVDVDVRRLLARAVVADGLDDPAVARRPGVGDDDAIGGLLLLAHAHEADLDGHELLPLRPREHRANRRDARPETHVFDQGSGDGPTPSEGKQASRSAIVRGHRGRRDRRRQASHPLALAALAGLGHRLHHLRDHLELLEQRVDLLGGGAAALRRSAAAATR